jgi:uncharacterized protein (TIGR02145 family)
VNEDGLVNVLDIISTVNYIMGGNPSPFNTDAADVNADGGINVLDIIALVNIIMQVPGMPCGCVAPVLYEGQTYSTVQIGSQCWFKENLNVGTMIISHTGGQLQTDNSIIEKYCYDNVVANCTTYGGLYEWNEAMHYTTTEGAQGICPIGWHLPTDNEWKVLEGTVDSQYPVGDPEWDGSGWRGYDAGGNLKESETAHWNPPNTGATNSSGFKGLPGGSRDKISGSFYNIGNYGDFWPSSQYSAADAWYRAIGYVTADVYRSNSFKEDGFSVRCLKGCWPQPIQAYAGPDQLNVPGTSTTLAGNTPTYGTGIWHVISGTGGAIIDTANPTSAFTGLAGNAYSLTWTITTQCGSTMDTVVINFASGLGQPCPGMPTIEYEGQTYNTVLIGDQCWLRENLNVGMLVNGTTEQTNNSMIEKYCYNDSADSCLVYGGLYQWNEAMQYSTTEGAQGICPVGWHLPTDDQWKILEGTVDSQYGSGDPEWDKIGFRGFDAGGNLKESGIVHWISPNVGATNSSGFTGLPGGYRIIDGPFGNIGTLGYYWTSSQSDTLRGWSRLLSNFSMRISRPFYIKEVGMSIRCLND